MTEEEKPTASSVGFKGYAFSALEEEIDAKGHVVAPGFIDMHDHNAAAQFGQKLALRDGVTNPMELERGIPVYTWDVYLEGKIKNSLKRLTDSVMD